MPWDSQDDYAVRFDWGTAGVARLAGHVEAIVIVDVLRFTTAVETVVNNAGTVYPYKWRDPTAADFATRVGAALADSSLEDGPTLCPMSLLALGKGAKVVLPSPNGAGCALKAAEMGCRVVAGSMRNAAGVARWLGRNASSVGIIACGEIWQDGSLLPAIGDLLGAAEIISHLPGTSSPEAVTAESTLGISSDLYDLLARSSSGIALSTRGHADDVKWAAQRSVSGCVPLLDNGRFVAATVSG